MHSASPSEPVPPSPAAAIRCAAASSTHERIDVALREAAASATATLGRPADLACVFVSGRYASAIRPAMEGLADLLDVPAVVGTTAEAILAGEREHESEPAVAVWLASIPGGRVIPFALEYTQTPDGGMFAGWPSEPAGGWPTEGSVVLLADPFSFPVDGFIARLAEEHPDDGHAGVFLSQTRDESIHGKRERVGQQHDA
ncbi:MAG: FIST N-terminal domain-containing protein, partial [Planctomycetia bacterium]